MLYILVNKNTAFRKPTRLDLLKPRYLYTYRYANNNNNNKNNKKTDGSENKRENNILQVWINVLMNLCQVINSTQSFSVCLYAVINNVYMLYVHVCLCVYVYVCVCVCVRIPGCSCMDLDTKYDAH